MELHTFDFVAAVAESHDDAVVRFCADDQLARQGFSLDDKGMVARCGERIGQLAENVLVVVMNLAGFAMEKLRCADDFSAERGADGLVTEANA